MAAAPAEELFDLVRREAANRIADTYEIIANYPDVLKEGYEYERDRLKRLEENEDGG